jgi:hypothetical protein
MQARYLHSQGIGALQRPDQLEGGTMHPIGPALPVLLMGGLAVLYRLARNGKIKFSIKVRWRRRRR